MAPLVVPDEGLDWRWVTGSHTTDPGCPGSERFPFVPGYAPSSTPCPYGSPSAPAVDEAAGSEDEGGGFWSRLFGGGSDAEPDPAKRLPQQPAPAPVDGGQR